MVLSKANDIAFFELIYFLEIQIQVSLFADIAALR